MSIPSPLQTHFAQRGCVVWFTGLSGSGKSTLSGALEQRLLDARHPCYVLDGDVIRNGLCSDLGFSHADRTENIRRIGHVAALFANAGLIALTAFISPYRADRETARKAAGAERFLEVYMDIDVDGCEARDPKGLYKKARAGQISGFTGIDAPYEPPEAPALALPTGRLAVGECVEQLYDLLAQRGFIDK